MGRANVWRRLLWKEYREGRWVALIALLAPAVCFSMAARYNFNSWQRGLFAFPGTAGMHLAIAFWAAGRGAGKRQGSEFARSHLPVHPFGEWTASFLVPALVTTALGCWFGFWANKAMPDYPVVWSIQAGALDLVTTYAICYLMSAIISSWAAIVVAALRVAAGTLINVWSLSPYNASDVLWFAGRIALGALLGSLVFTALAQKKSLAFRQAVSLMLLVAVIFVPLIGNFDTSWLFPKSERRIFYGGGNTTSQGLAVHVDFVWNKQAAKELHVPKGWWFCENHRTGTLCKREFPERTQLMDIAGEKWVFLALQPRRRGPIVITRWDSTTNRVRKVARIPTKGIALETGFNHASPDGSYLLTVMESLIGNGYDLWLVDLKSGRSEIVMPCMEERWLNQAVFLRDRVIVSGERILVTIDYHTLNVKPLCIPGSGLLPSTGAVAPLGPVGCWGSDNQ